MLCSLAVSVAAVAAASRPNVLFILCDNLRPDAVEMHNLVNDPKYATRRRELDQQLAAMIATEGLTTDKEKMPLGQGIKTELPDQKIRKTNDRESGLARSRSLPWYATRSSIPTCTHFRDHCWSYSLDWPTARWAPHCLSAPARMRWTFRPLDFPCA